MRFGSRRHSAKANIIPSYAERNGANQVVEDASLKAAQAMFKKHSVGQVPAIQAPRPVPIRVSSSSSRHVSANMGRRSPRMTVPRSGASSESVARSVSPLDGTTMDRGESGVSDAAQQAASVALDSEINMSGDGSYSLAIPAHVTSSDVYLSSRNSSKLSLPRQHSPSQSVGLANKLHSMSLESVSTVGNSPGTAHSGNKTLIARKDGTVGGVPSVLVESDGTPMVFRDDMSEQDDRSLRNITYDTTTKMNVPVTYKGTLPDLIPVHQRHRKKRWHSIFGGIQSSGISGLASGGSSSWDHEQNGVAGGTVSEVQFNQADDNLVVKSENPMQKTRLRTTMRPNNNNYTAEQENDMDSSGDSSNESTYSANSEFDKRHSMDVTGSHTDIHLFSNTGTSTKKKRRSIMRSHKRHSFNEDKPWKSHVDIGYVSEKERKRYEGIWVTNRNSYLELLPWWDENDLLDDEDHTIFPQDGLILNQVVLDLWSRSNLPPQLLAQIYDKVDTRRDCTLNRQSFLIGMWLVDQCLYGRKLPKEIDQRVWDSVEKFSINIPNNNPHHHHRRRKKMLKKELKTIKKELNI